MSGYRKELVLGENLERGTTAYLAKPFSPTELASLVRARLDGAVRNPRVLIVDDDAGIRALCERTLSGAGFATQLAENGGHALEILDSRRVDLIVTDLVMPEKEGIELIQSVRKRHPAIPIVAMSGWFNGSFLMVAQKLGASAVLEKPFSPGVLVDTVRSLLAKPEAMTAAAGSLVE